MKVYTSLKAALADPEAVRALALERLDDFPMEILELVNLEKLSLGWVKRLPASIARLSRLEVLRLPYGQAPLPSTVGRLENLRELHWSAFCQGLTVPATVGKLRNLRVLNLYLSKITELPDEVYGLSNLEVLSLQDCHAFVELPPAVARLSSLRTLVASHSRLTRIPFELTQLEHLELFDFASTPLARRATTKGKKSVATLRRKMSTLSVPAQRTLFRRTFGQ